MIPRSDRPDRSPARNPIGRLTPLLVGPLLVVGLAFWTDPGVLVRRVLGMDPGWVLGALAVSVGQVVLSAWRWQFTAGRLGLRLPFPRAVAEYYLATFLNQMLPGGVAGDVGRAWRDGRAREAHPARAWRAVVLERTSGQVVVLGVALVSLAILLTSRLTGGAGPTELLLEDARTAGSWFLASLVGVVLLCGLAFLWIRRARPGTLANRVRREAWRALLAPRALPVQLLASTGVVASYLVVFVLSARAMGVTTPLPLLVPLIAPVLVAMLIPVSVAGWGVREGVAAALWMGMGLPAADGVAASVGYGLVVLVSSLPGAFILLWAPRGPTSRSGPGQTGGHDPARDAAPSDESPGPWSEWPEESVRAGPNP